MAKQDFGDSMDRGMFPRAYPAKTEITDITLSENGKDNAFFSVKGKDFGCGFSTECGGVCAGEEGWITFSGYGGHQWIVLMVVTAITQSAEAGIGAVILLTLHLSALLGR